MLVSMELLMMVEMGRQSWLALMDREADTRVAIWEARLRRPTWVMIDLSSNMDVVSVWGYRSSWVRGQKGLVLSSLRYGHTATWMRCPIPYPSSTTFLLPISKILRSLLPSLEHYPSVNAVPVFAASCITYTVYDTLAMTCSALFTQITITTPT